MAAPWSIRTAIFKLLKDDVGPGSSNKLFNTSSNSGLIATATSIYHRSGPQDIDFPMVAIHKQAGSPMYSFGSDEDNYFFENSLWTVKGVCRGLTSEPAELIDERCLELLQDAELPLPGLTTMWFRREEDVDYGEREEGAIIHHVGAMYRLLTEAA